MMKREIAPGIVCVLALLSGASLSLGVWAQPEPEKPAPTTTYVDDDDTLAGDRLRLWTNVTGFTPAAGSDSSAKCAIKDSTLIVRREKEGGLLTVIFYSLAQEPVLATKTTKDEWEDAVKDCPKEKRVNLHTPYTIQRSVLEGSGYRRTGMTFGALVVPFKYRMGGDKKIISSSTVAPYIGFRTGFGQSYGATFTPLISAGLGLVPVTDPATNQTETKNALSVAVGMVLTSSKNQKFNAGVVVGWDFMSEADQARDPNAEKPWLSFYVGSNF